MKKILSVFVWAFYIVIILYVLFAVVKIDTLANFASAITFEVIGFAALAFFIFCNMFSDSMKVGYLVPMILVTVLYTVILDFVNIFLVVTTSSVFFILINLVLLFLYCLIIIPMYLMGRK